AIAVGDTVSGDVVTTIYAQHTSFARRQFSSAGCTATAYMVLDDDPDLDCDEGGCGGTQKGAQLFTSCAAACPVITVNPASLPNPVQGAAYNRTITAVGGAAPYTFAVTAGALPPLLNLSAGGALTGTATTTGSFNFTVTATDSGGCTGARAYTIGVGTVALTLTPASRTVLQGSSASFTATINPTQSTATLV